MTDNPMKLEELTNAVDNHRQSCAPGSECQAWQDYVDDCHQQLGCAPWSDPSLVVPDRMADYWLDRLEGIHRCT